MQRRVRLVLCSPIVCRLLSAGAGQGLIEGRAELALAERFFEKTQRLPDADEVECAGVRTQNRADVIEILGSTGKGSPDRRGGWRRANACAARSKRTRSS
jgi:hypothetical protein